MAAGLGASPVYMLAHGYAPALRCTASTFWRKSSVNAFMLGLDEVT